MKQDTSHDALDERRAEAPRAGNRRAGAVAGLDRTAILRAAAAAEALPPGPEQMQALAAAARQYADWDGAAALAWAAALPDAATRDVALQEVARVLVRRDPRAAATAVAELSEGLGRDDAACSLAAQWGRIDAPAALAWTREFSTSALRARMLGAVGFELAEVDALAAAQLAQSELTGLDRTLFLTSITQAWATRAPGAAAQWVETLPDPELRARLWAVALAGLALAAPREAAAVALQLPAGLRRDEAIQKVAVVWSHQKPADAAAWLATAGEGAAQAAAWKTVATNWASIDPDTAGRRLLELPAGEGRDAAVTAYIEVLCVESPSWAAKWLAALPPSEQLNREIERVARQWLEFNRAAAETWLRQTSLPGERQQKLLALAP